MALGAITNNHISLNSQVSAKTTTEVAKNQVIGNCKPQHHFGPFILTNRIGSGTFGQVFEGFDKTKKIMAIKVTEIEDLNNDQDTKNSVGCEVETWIRVNNHRNVVKLFCTTKIDSTFVFAMESAVGDLRKFLELNGDNEERIEERVTQNVIWQTLCGVMYLHSKNVCHRDMKPENILISGGGRVLITDFGWAKFFTNKKMYTIGGSAEYLAPEILKGSGYSASVDNWAVGMIMFECLTGRNYFLDKMTRSTKKSYTSKKNFLQRNVGLFRSVTRARDLSSSKISRLAQSVIAELLHMDPNQRLGSYTCGDSVLAEARVRQHPFFYKMSPNARLPLRMVQEMTKLNGSSLASNLRSFKRIDEWRKKVLPATLVNVFDEFEYVNHHAHEDHTQASTVLPVQSCVPVPLQKTPIQLKNVRKALDRVPSNVEITNPEMSKIPAPKKIALPEPGFMSRFAQKRKNLDEAKTKEAFETDGPSPPKIALARKVNLDRPIVTNNCPNRILKPLVQGATKLPRPQWKI